MWHRFFLNKNLKTDLIVEIIYIEGLEQGSLEIKFFLFRSWAQLSLKFFNLI